MRYALYYFVELGTVIVGVDIVVDEVGSVIGNRWSSHSAGFDSFNLSAANVTTRDSCLKRSRFQSLGDRLSELLIFLYSGQPEGVGRSKVVASTTAVALDKWRRSEGFQTRTG
jgi:hypothetical protein